jgi:transposase
MREIVDAIFYALRGGVPWRMLPTCFPPRQTVYGWFAAFRDAGVGEALNHHRALRDRERAGREASPSAAVIDSQGVKSSEAGGPRGYDAGKKVQGRKRHAVVDTDGRPLVLRCHAASVQDRDGAIPLLRASRRRFPFVPRVVPRAFADAAYAAERVADATRIAVEIVRTPKEGSGRVRRPPAPLGGRTMLRMARPQSAPCQGLRGPRRLRDGLPLRRFHQAPHAPHRTFRLSSETASEGPRRQAGR